MPIERRLALLAVGSGGAAGAAAVACLGLATATRPAHALARDAMEELRGGDAPRRRRRLPAPRGEFSLDDGLAYLNAGTLGPMPQRVVAGVSDELARLAGSPHHRYFGGEDDGDDDTACARMDAVRAAAAAYFRCHEHELALMPSTTSALNTVAGGLADSGFLEPSHRVLTTDQEHPGGEACWRHLVGIGRLAGIDRVAIAPQPASPEEIADAFAAALTPETSVIAVSHVLTTSGVVMPLVQLARLARVHGALLVVDGAQAAGSLDVHLGSLEVDIYAVSAHKWMLAPPGSALLYLRRGIHDLVRATHFDGDRPPNSAQLDGSYAAKPELRFAAYTHSTGTLPSHTVAGIGEAIGFLSSFGQAKICAYNLGLRTRCWKGLDAPAFRAIGLRLLSPPPGSSSASPLLSFSLPEDTHPSGALADRLHKEHGIVVKTCPHHSIEEPTGNATWRNAIRLSFHLFNTEEEVDKLVGALESTLLHKR